MSDRSKTREQLYNELEELRRQVKDLTAEADPSGDPRPRSMRIATLLHNAQEMQSVSALARGVGHAMNNVLSVVLGVGSVLQTEFASDDPKRRDIEDIVAAARKGKLFIRNFLAFTTRATHKSDVLSLNDTIAGLTQLLSRSVPNKVTIQTDLAAEIRDIECDSEAIGRLVMNLCTNAIDAVSDGGTITVSTRNETIRAGSPSTPKAGPGDYVSLTVADDGVGMDGETRERAFEPFFTTKDDNKGTGLGLSMVYGTVDDHGGAVTIDSAPGKGTTVTVLFPAAPPRAVAEAPAARAPRARKNNAKILLVDDEEMVRRAGERMLVAAGHVVLAAADGAAALELLRKGEEVDLVVLDLHMPGMDGAECLEKLKELRPRLPILICTGYSSPQESEELIAGGALGVVRKPFDTDELADAIAAAMEEAAGRQ